MLRRLIFTILSVHFFSHVTFAGNIQPIKEIVEPPAKNFPENKFGKVAVLQWAPAGVAPLTKSAKEAELWKNKNRETIAEYIREAVEKGAKLIVTPEFSVVGYPDIPELPDEEDNFRTPQEIEPYAETVPGPTSQFFAKLAKKYQIYIHIGLAERGSKKDEYHNTIFVLSPDGDVVAKYHKIHLYQIEENYLVPGQEPIVYNNKYFGKVGLVACSDVYSNKPMDNYASMKIDVLALSTSWAQSNTGWSNFVSGAKWVNAYLLAANQSYFPDSGVIEPSGREQSHIRQSDGLAYGYLPLKK